MFDNVLFFVYIFAGFAGLLSVIFAALLIRYWKGGNRRMLGALLGFELCNVIIAAMYFCYYFMKISGNSYTSHMIIRVLDIWMYIGQSVMWAAYLKEKGRVAVAGGRRFKAAVVTVLLAASAVLYGVLMDGYYYAAECAVPAFFIEAAVGIATIGIVLIYTYKSLHQILLRKIRRLIIAIALITMINNLWNVILSFALIKGIDLIGSVPNADMTPVMILIISALVIVLLAGEDFSSLFVRPEGENDFVKLNEKPRNSCLEETDAISAESLTGQKELLTADITEQDIQTRLNIIAVEHMLTEREREVMEHAYNGMTNPQMAIELGISQSTVKRHMHNLFEKLDVKSRIELIHMINNWIDTRK